MNKVGKQQVVDHIAGQTNLTKKDITAVLKHYQEAIIKHAKAGDHISFIGFGTFGTRQRAARMGQNPKTGEKLSIAATTVPYFKPGSAFKEAVNTQKK